MNFSLLIAIVFIDINLQICNYNFFPQKQLYFYTHISLHINDI